VISELGIERPQTHRPSHAIAGGKGTPEKKKKKEREKGETLYAEQEAEEGKGEHQRKRSPKRRHAHSTKSAHVCSSDPGGGGDPSF